MTKSHSLTVTLGNLTANDQVCQNLYDYWVIDFLRILPTVLFSLLCLQQAKATQTKFIVFQAFQLEKGMRDAHFFFILKATPTNLKCGLDQV